SKIAIDEQNPHSMVRERNDEVRCSGRLSFTRRCTCDKHRPQSLNCLRENQVSAKSSICLGAGGSHVGHRDELFDRFFPRRMCCAVACLFGQCALMSAIDCGLSDMPGMDRELGYLL